MKSSNPFFSPIPRALVAAAVVLTAGSLAAYAQTSSPRETSSSPGNPTYGSTSDTPRSADRDSDMAATHTSRKLSWGDRRFVTKAADSSQEEVALAKLAAERADNPDVRNFAQQLVEQHTQVNSQLMNIASTKHVKIDEDDATKERAYRRLSKATGTDFDREFVDHMLDEHEKDVKMYEKAANHAKDPEVRQFASSTLEHLRQHLSQVQQLQQSIVPTGRMDEQSGRSSKGATSTSTSTPSAWKSGNTTTRGASSGSATTSSGTVR